MTEIYRKGFYSRNALKIRKNGIVDGQEFGHILLVRTIKYMTNILQMILQYKCIENQGKNDCQWSGI